MNLEIMYHPLLEAMGGALVHSLWQGALVAGALYLALRVYRSSDVRYALCGGALALLFLLPVSTGVQIYVQNQPAPGLHSVSQDVAAASAVERPIGEVAPVGDGAIEASSATQHPVLKAYTSTFAWRPFLVGAWLIGVLMLSLSWVSSLIGVHRLRSKGLGTENDSLQTMFSSLLVELGISQQVRLLLTIHVDQPMVIGWLKPVVLVPLSVATSLPPDQVEAILAHELAHVRRQDYLVLVLQSVMEILFFYHPAVWWVSHQMRTEREYCCDDLVTKALDNDLVYVSALANLDTQRAGRLALGANDGSLVDRVRRIVDRKVGRGRPRHLSWFGVGGVLLGCGMLITACVNWGQPNLDGSPEELYAVAIEKVRERNFTSAKLYAERAAEQGDICSIQLLINMYEPRPEKHFSEMALRSRMCAGGERMKMWRWNGPKHMAI